MAETFQELLGSIGFGAADAAAGESMITRKRDVAVAGVDIEADTRRRELAAGHEGRGVFGSGEALMDNARLEAEMANKTSQIDVAAADDYQKLMRDLQRDKAQKEASDRAFNLQVDLANRDWQMKMDQVRKQDAAQARYDEAYLGYMKRDW